MSKSKKQIIARWIDNGYQFGYRFDIDLNEDTFQFECFWSTTSISSGTDRGHVHLWSRDIIADANSAGMLYRIMRNAEAKIRKDYVKNGPDRSLGQQMLRIMRAYGVTHILLENRKDNPLEVTQVVDLMDRFIARVFKKAGGQT